MSFSSVAENTLIGIVTIPNEMAPFQIACIAISSLSARRPAGSAGQVPRSPVRPLRREEVRDLLCRVPQQVFTFARVEGEDSVFVAGIRGVTLGHLPQLGGLGDHLDCVVA